MGNRGSSLNVVGAEAASTAAQPPSDLMQQQQQQPNAAGVQRRGSARLGRSMTGQFSTFTPTAQEEEEDSDPAPDPTKAFDKAQRYTNDPSRLSVFNIWSGLERQLELSFAAMDQDDVGLVAYSQLEPLMRHHLMQMGLLETLVPFFLPSGELDAAQIAPYLARFNLDLDQELDLEDWKNLAVSWTHRLLDARVEAVKDWKDAEAAMQAEQATRYVEAMHRFQEHYIDSLHSYYRSVKAAHDQEQRYRDEWEGSLALQEEFKRQQMEFVQNANAEAMALYHHNLGDASPGLRLLLERLDLGRSVAKDGGAAVVKYAYPVNVSSTGAPISGGAPLPRRRPRRRAADTPLASTTVGCM